MLKNLFISTKLKINVSIIIVGLIVLAITSYTNIKSLESNYNQSKYLSEQVDYYKSVLIGGLLVNSASGVYAFNPESLKPIKAAQKGLDKVKKFYKKIDKKDDELFNNFIKIAQNTLVFAKNNEFLDTKNIKTLLKVWRPLKFDVTKKVQKVQKDEKILSKKFDEMLNNLFIEIFIVIIIITVLVIALNIIISRGVIESIETLENSMKDLSEGKSSGKIRISNNDETAVVAKYFNTYMENVQLGLTQDKEVISEVKEVIKKINSGLFNVSIKNKANSNEVNDLVNELNNMIENTSRNLTDLSYILKEYAKSKFNHPIKHIDGLTGLMASMFSGVKATGNTVQELLALIDNSNKKLLYSSKDLSSSSQKLSQSSNAQAASLEETAAAIEEVTATLIESSKNTTQMDIYAKNVIDSLSNGEKLANNTASSMDEITEQVTAINEAITIIDQISFQTNILSLNAAVEAATAGEAGKGFAVVAQEVRNLASRSAEAANQIKELVETAKEKAEYGKTISTDMINGYSKLNENVTNTTDLINKVATATKEQESAMKQINDAVNSLDKTTQQNASESSKISKMAKENEHLNLILQSAIDGTEFDENCKRRVCDVDMIFEVTKLKLNHIDFKDNAIEKASAGTPFKVKTHDECTLGSWINSHQNSNFGNSKAFSELKKAHEDVHKKTQEVVDLHVQNNNNDKLLEVANDIEDNIDVVFDKLNEIREINCNHLKND